MTSADLAQCSPRPRARARGWLVAASALIAAGCATPRCTRGEGIALRLSPSKQLNQDRDGYSRSVVVRLYQLDSAERFRNITFDELWATRESGTPERPVVVAPEELTLLPGKREQRFVKRAPAAGYFAVVANFREHQAGSGWQAVVRLPRPKNACVAEASPVSARVEIDLTDYGLQLR